MAMNEEAIITVSESREVTDDIIVVKEALEQLPPSEPLPVTQRPMAPLSPPEDEEHSARTESKGWLDSQSAKDFMPFLTSEMKRIKPPSACIGRRNEAERAFGQSRKLNNYISKALQSDWEGSIPVDEVDRLRQQLEQNIEALTRMLEAHKEMKKQRRQVRRHASDEAVCPTCTALLWEEGENMVCLACGQQELKKEAGTSNFQGSQVQISAFEHAVTGMLINAVVSGGRNLEELYSKLKKKYKFDDREELALLQIMEDKGYPTFKDRARVGESEDTTDPDEPREWMSNYYA
jgi:hypothetical protein